MLSITGAESRNPVECGVHYHQPLRRIYRKIRRSGSDLQVEHALRLAIKVVSDAIISRRLVPSSIAFGVLPRFLATNSELPSQAERMRALLVARAKMETITSELRLFTALNASLQSAAKHEFKAGRDFLVCPKKENPFKWIKCIGSPESLISRSSSKVVERK